MKEDKKKVDVEEPMKETEAKEEKKCWKWRWMENGRK